MKITHLLLVILIALGAGYAGSQLTIKTEPGVTAATPAETAYERVMRTGTLRCGYELWDSAVMQDPNTGEFSGAVVELMDELAKGLDLKIEWTARVGWGESVTALKSEKVDAICAGMWESGLKAKSIAFTTPIAYQGMEAFVRSDEARFTDIKQVNNPDVKLAVIDNDNSFYIAKSEFSKAQLVALGQLNGTDAELLLHVGTRKADVTFTVTGMWRQFDKNNPGMVKRLAPGNFLRTFGLSLAVVDNADLRLKAMLDIGIGEMLNAGIVDRVLTKYNAQYPDMFTLTAKRYQ